MGLLNEDGYSYSELSRDIQKHGIKCIEGVPQIDEVREMHRVLTKESILETNNLNHNLQAIG